MDKQLATWNLILKSLQQHIPVMLLYVLDSRGSSPGRQGFFMAVNTHHEIEGSIGGGIMEYKFVEMAKEKLAQDQHEASVRRQVHNKEAAKNQSGMICSGEQTILIYPVQPEDVTTIQGIITSLEQYKNGLLALSPTGLRFSDDIPGKEFDFTMRSEEDWQYKEKTGYKNHLFIVGGGHCALALSNLMRNMDFYIHVYDDRPDLHTLTRNTSAHEKILVQQYEELKELIPADPHNHYVTIMTLGYRTDDIAVRALLDKQFKYFGLMGSKAKIDKLFADYRAAGMPVEKLKKIYSPIGIPIKSELPEEIAISIAAEIIQVKNGEG